MKSSSLAIGVLMAAAASMPVAHAADSPWAVQVGVHNVDPKSNNGTDADVHVKSAAMATFNVRYFFSDAVALDVLAALPFKHDVKIDGVGEVASVKHLPPTVSLMWYPMPASTIKPFVGAGLNYTMFFSEKTKGALDGADLKLKDSVGLAAMAGVEFKLDDHSGIVADLRWMDIDSKAKVNGGSIGTVHIDPIAYGLAYIYRF